MGWDSLQARRHTTLSARRSRTRDTKPTNMAARQHGRSRPAAAAGQAATVWRSAASKGPGHTARQMAGLQGGRHKGAERSKRRRPHKLRPRRTGLWELEAEKVRRRWAAAGRRGGAAQGAHEGPPASGGCCAGRAAASAWNSRSYHMSNGRRRGEACDRACRRGEAAGGRAAALGSSAEAWDSRHRGCLYHGTTQHVGGWGALILGRLAKPGTAAGGGGHAAASSTGCLRLDGGARQYEKPEAGEAPGEEGVGSAGARHTL